VATRVPAVRPRPVPVLSASVPASSPPSAVPSSSSSSRQPVRVVWDELRGSDVAVCDAELAALLALVTSRRAA
jgi:hypothetical protein